MRRARRSVIGLGLGWALVLLGGCTEDLSVGSTLADLRVLGAVVSVDGDLDRQASPRPGETATVELIVAAPAPNVPFSWAALACATEVSSFGRPSACLGAPLFVGGGQADGVAPLMWEVTAPTVEEEPTAGELTVLAVLCPEGTPNLDALSDPESLPPNLCEAPTEPGEAVLVRVPVTTGGSAPNVSPRFPDAGVSLDGQGWEPADPPPQTGCVDGAARVRSASEGVAVLRFEGWDSADRERFTRLVDVPPRPVDERETLTLSHFTSLGELERQFSAVDADDAAPDVEWEPPPAAEVDEGGAAVRFVFVVRDGRGGTDWAERWLCLVP